MSFQANPYGKMKNAVNEFINKGVKGVIIDLRSNPGGLLDEVVDICRLLVQGPIVNYTVQRRNSGDIFIRFGVRTLQAGSAYKQRSASASG